MSKKTTGARAHRARRTAERKAAKAAGNVRPRYWERRVAAALLFMSVPKITQLAVARAISVSARTIRYWMDEPSWADARAEARDRWMARGEDAARAAVFRSLEAGNAQLGTWFLERIDEQFAPKQKHEHEGAGGGPIEVLVKRTIIRPNGDR